MAYRLGWFPFLLCFMAVSVASLNVRSIGSSRKRAVVFDYLSSLKNDIFCLQECGLRYAPKQDEWRGESFWSPACGNKSTGVGILIKNAKIKVLEYKIITPGRCVMIFVDYVGFKFKLFNVYAPADKRDRIDFFQNLQFYLMGRTPIIIAGDFNAIRDGADRAGGAEGGMDRSSTILNNMIEDLGLVDLGKKASLGENRFTFFSETGKIKSRIDFIFCSKGLVAGVFSHFSCFFSDHQGIQVVFKMEVKVAFGPGVWKLNTSILDDVEVKEGFKLLYAHLVQKKKLFKDCLEWWDWAKVRIRGFFQGWGRRKAKEKQEDFARLNARRRTLLLFKEFGKEVEEEIRVVKEEIKEFVKERGKRIIFQAKTKFSEENEKCTRYFFKKVCGNKDVLVSVDVDGRQVEGDGVVVEVENFFKKQFAGYEGEEVSEMADYCKILDCKVGKEDGEWLEREVSKVEVKEVLGSMAKNKTPGSDGLPVEFYSSFWDIIEVEFCEVMNEVFVSKKVSDSMKEGLITLIFKKGAKSDLRNWRPITLLNTDYKVAAKIVANRLKYVIGKVLGPWQTCAIPGRRVSDNLILLRDMIKYVEMNNMPLIVESLDLEKAFDRVSHNFMLQVMRSLGFPKGLLSVIRGFYSGIRSKVVVNGILSNQFDVRSGVRQGCPLSPIAFICVIEPFLKHIQADKVCRGFTIPGSGGTSVKSMAYMDDVVLVGSSQRELDRFGLQAEIFCVASKMKVNWAKSCLCNLGKEVEVKDNKLEVKNKVKVLGVVFDKKMNSEESYTELYSKIKRKLDFWKIRELSLRGKILVIKAVILPLILYTAVVLPPGKVWLIKANKALYTFLWGSRMERVRRELVMRPCELGGLNFPDLEKFVSMHFWLLVWRTLKVGGRTGLMMEYMGGWLFRKWRWSRWELVRPVSFFLSAHYKKLERVREDYGLGVLGVEGGDVKKVKKLLYNETKVCNIFGLRSCEAARAWSALGVVGVSNRQRDVAWLALQDALPTREFLKKRDIITSDRCLRERCGGVESTKHVLWDCKYAGEVRGRFKVFFETISKCKLSYMSLLTGAGLCKVEGEHVGWWFCFILKESLWDMRNQLVMRKEQTSVSWCCRVILARLHTVFLGSVRRIGEDKSKAVWKRLSWSNLVRVGVD